MNPHIEHRVRERAYRIWLDEGMPEGRADLHWEIASELVAGEPPVAGGAAAAALKPRKSGAAPKSAAPAAKKTAKPASETPAAKRTGKAAS